MAMSYGYTDREFGTQIINHRGSNLGRDDICWPATFMDCMISRSSGVEFIKIDGVDFTKRSILRGFFFPKKQVGLPGR